MASLIQSGIPDTFPIKIFETDVGAVAAGTANGGWVSGSPANLAASASVNCVFDLGQDWSQFTHVSVAIRSSGTSTGLNNIQASSSDTATLNASRRLKDVSQVNHNSIAGNITTAGGTQQAIVRPMGRYFIVSLTNADATNPQDASAKVTIAAYPC